MPLRKVHEPTFRWFGLPGPLLTNTAYQIQSVKAKNAHGGLEGQLDKTMRSIIVGVFLLLGSIPPRPWKTAPNSYQYYFHFLRFLLKAAMAITAASQAARDSDASYSSIGSLAARLRSLLGAVLQPGGSIFRPLFA